MASRENFFHGLQQRTECVNTLQCYAWFYSSLLKGFFYYGSVNIMAYGPINDIPTWLERDTHPLETHKLFKVSLKRFCTSHRFKTNGKLKWLWTHFFLPYLSKQAFHSPRFTASQAFKLK